MDIDRLDRGDTPWSGAELAAVLRHQMGSALRWATDVLRGDAHADTLPAGPAGETFEQLLTRPDPPAERLDLARRCGKAAMGDPDSPLPREVGAILYYVSILVARQRCSRPISGLSDAALLQGIEVVLQWPWFRAFPRTLLEDGLAALRRGEAGEQR